MFRRMDYAEYGGVPLLGVNGSAIISHGRSNAKAIKNALREARQTAETNVAGAIADGLARFQPGSETQKSPSFSWRTDKTRGSHYGGGTIARCNYVFASFLCAPSSVLLVS